MQKERDERRRRAERSHDASVRGGAKDHYKQSERVSQEWGVNFK